VALGQFDDLLARLDDPAGALHDLHARGGERHALGRALDELHAEVFLELLELRGERGLAHEGAFRRAPEVARVGDRHEISQVFEFEVGHR
jgi:hypothetical protein